MRKKSIIIIIFILTAVSHSARSQHLNFKHLTTSDGLPSDMVYEVFQDHTGFIWFGTSAGASRFDGYTFTNYTIQDGLGDNEIFGFYEDSSHRLWFRTLNGKVSYYLKGKIYNADNTPILKELNKPSPIRHITETDEHDILITHFSYGLAILTTQNEIKSFSPANPSGYITVFLDAHKSKLGGYAVITSGGLFNLDVNGAQIDFSDANHTLMRVRFVNDHYYASDGRYVYKFSELTPDPIPVVETNGLTHGIFHEGENLIWLCTSRGALRFDIKSEKVIEKYLEDEEVSSVIKDNEGNLWFTTLNKGVFALINHAARNYSKAGGLSSDNVFSINKDNEGNIWLGHDNYTLTKIDKTGVISTLDIVLQIPKSHEAITPHIYQVNVNGSEFVIAGTPASIYLNNGEITFANALNGRSIQKWFGDRYLVAGGINGVRTFSMTQLIANKRNRKFSAVMSDEYPTAKPKYGIEEHWKPRTNCTYLHQDGEMWLGTDDGLWLLTKDSVISYNQKYPILQGRILDIKQDKFGVLYLATDGKGIIILKDGNTIQINQKNGLSSNRCSKIQLDNDNNSVLWVGTNAGVNKITLREDRQPQSIFTINTSHGIASDDIHDLFADTDKIWIAASGGLSTFNKNISDSDYSPPITYITSLIVNGAATDTLQKEFHYRENNLQISFVGLSYKSIGRINYKYRLSGLDEDVPWQETKNTSVDLSSITHGTYTFTVMAQNSSGLWGNPAIYSFRIKSPFWNTWWFITLSILAISSATLGIGRYYQKVQRKRNDDKKKLQFAQMKSLRSQMNFHFMSNAFNSLQGLFISENGVDKYIGKFSKLMRQTLEFSDRHMIKLSEELEYLQLYTDIEQLRVGDNFIFMMEVDDALKKNDPVIPALMLQPFIENAIWHGIMPKGDPGIVRLTVTPIDPEHFKIVIEDDGIGVNAALASKIKNSRKSFGTKLTMDRFELIRQQSKNKLEITIEDLWETSKRNGTAVTIVLPFIYNEKYDND